MSLKKLIIPIFYTVILITIITLIINFQNQPHSNSNTQNITDCIQQFPNLNLTNITYINKKCSKIGYAASQEINATIKFNKKIIGKIEGKYHPGGSGGNGIITTTYTINNYKTQNLNEFIYIRNTICKNYKTDNKYNNSYINKILIKCKNENFGLNLTNSNKTAKIIIEQKYTRKEVKYKLEIQ